MIDFIRFDYSREFDFGFKEYVVFGETTSRNVQGCVIRAESPKEVRMKLRNANGFVGVISDRIEVNRYAVMRKKVDAILDFPGRRLDYTTFKLANEKDVIIELSLHSLLSAERGRMVKLAHELRTVFKVINKFDTPFILTSGADNLYSMRPRKQICELFSYFGADVRRAEYWAERLHKKLFDENHIMDGVELV